MLIIIAVAVQMLNLLEVYRHPNFSPSLSIFVIVYVSLGDISAALIWLLRKSVQPYQTLEDFEKLKTLKSVDEAAYKAIIQRMVREHQSKGIITRIFGRPKMPRLPG